MRWGYLFPDWGYLLKLVVVTVVEVTMTLAAGWQWQRAIIC